MTARVHTAAFLLSLALFAVASAVVALARPRTGRAVFTVLCRRLPSPPCFDRGGLHAR